LTFISAKFTVLSGNKTSLGSSRYKQALHGGDMFTRYLTSALYLYINCSSKVSIVGRIHKANPLSIYLYTLFLIFYMLIWPVNTTGVY